MLCNWGVAVGRSGCLPPGQDQQRGWVLPYLFRPQQRILSHQTFPSSLLPGTSSSFPLFPYEFEVLRQLDQAFARHQILPHT